MKVTSASVDFPAALAQAQAGQPLSAADTKRVFEAVPMLGQQFLPTLSMKDRISAHSTNDYMVAARFGAPVAEVDRRARFVLHLDESDGKSFEFLER